MARPRPPQAGLAERAPHTLPCPQGSGTSKASPAVRGDVGGSEAPHERRLGPGGRGLRLNPPPAPQIRTLRLKILAEAAAEGVPVRGARNQLRMYLTMAVAAAQPLLMYWLTFHLVR